MIRNFYIYFLKYLINILKNKFIKMYRHNKPDLKTETRALCSQTSFRQQFFQNRFRFSEMDKNKCPKSKTQFTFRIFFVTESFSNILIINLLPIMINDF